MALKKFSEYISQSGKLQEKPVVTKVPDYEGEQQSKPPQGTGAKPYKAGTDASDPNKGKLKDGFADMGDDALEYNPVTSSDKDSNSVEGIPGGKTVKGGWTNTQEWVEKTKNMPLAQFTKLLRNESLKGIEKEIAPHNSITETVSICKSNNNYVSALVREMKRNELFGQLVNEMVKHPESFKILASLMEKDESYARRLSMAMNEAVAGPIGMDQDVDDEDEEIKLKHHEPKHTPDMGDDEDYGDEDSGEDEEDHDDEDHDEDEELDHDEDEEMHHHHHHHHDEEPTAQNAHAALSQMKDSPAMAAFMRSR
jgi:hypothetical protein